VSTIRSITFIVRIIVKINVLPAIYLLQYIHYTYYNIYSLPYVYNMCVCVYVCDVLFRGNEWFLYREKKDFFFNLLSRVPLLLFMYYKSYIIIYIYVYSKIYSRMHNDDWVFIRWINYRTDTRVRLLWHIVRRPIIYKYCILYTLCGRPRGTFRASNNRPETVAVSV
jgi:hypothetical protein